jgi:hypothetical protein
VPFRVWCLIYLLLFTSIEFGRCQCFYVFICLAELSELVVKCMALESVLRVELML